MSQQQTADLIILPSFKERFSKVHWTQIKEKIYLLNASTEAETVPEITKILNFIQELNNTSNHQNFFGDPEIKNWFYDEFFHSTAKNLLNTKSFNSKEVLKMVNQILEEMMVFWFKAIDEDHVKLTAMVQVILDPSRQYYKINDQDDSSSPVNLISGFYLDAHTKSLSSSQ